MQSLLALLILGAAPGAIAKKEKLVGLLGTVKSGTVKSVGEDELSFSFKAKGKTYEVVWSNETDIRAHKVTTLGDLEEGTSLNILAVHQPPQPGSAGGNFPPMIIRVNTIVAGEGFVPPPVPLKLRLGGVKWLSGELKIKEKKPHLEEIRISTGSERKVLLIEKATRKMIAKKRTIFVGGELKTPDKKTKRIQASEIILVAAGFPRKEYSLSFNFSERKPKNRPTKDKRPDF